MLKFLGTPFRSDAATNLEAELSHIPAAPALGGLVAGSSVATARGWVPVEEVRVGDLVLTFDNGPQPVTCVTRRLYPYGPGEAARPVIVVPAGLIGNQRTLTLLPDQVVVVESDLAEAMTGDPFALVRAGALTVLEGVREVLPEESVAAAAFGFAEDEIVFVDGHALALCPAEAMLAPATLEDAVFAEASCRYDVMDSAEASVFLRHAVGATSGRVGPIH